MLPLVSLRTLCLGGESKSGAITAIGALPKHMGAFTNRGIFHQLCCQ